ncbi:hypothetical protein [Novipirellula caenicola]|uniref:Cadherin domain-containing protein n=1 Tax=Novipirellula caenicola TaxID=1536901 RepID=A0ABP9W084_9BACT
MNQRERFLAIAIGGLVGALVIQWGINKYQTAVKSRTTRIDALTNEKLKLEDRLLDGAYADRQLGEYLSRSLPGDPERAHSDYQSWLLDAVEQNGLSNPRVNRTNMLPVGDLYQRLSYSVDGRTDFPKLIEFLHAFYAKDYLHRMSKLAITPARDEPSRFDVKMSVDVIALSAAPEDAKPPTAPSWRVDPAVTAYSEPILNRNFFEPPNKAPQFTGKSVVDAIVGKDSTTPLTFKDPEGHQLRFELLESAPDFVRLDERTGTLTVKSDTKQEFDVKVRVTDDGYPNRTIEQKLVVKVGDPPPPPEPPAAKPMFDDSTQTVLTALVQGRDDWTAWMNVRTKGKTLKLRVNDEFEIGTLKGKVVEVTPKYVLLEIDGRRFELKPAGVLADAAKNSEPVEN